MDEAQKYTVLGRAEAYREDIARTGGGDATPLHRSFEEARALLLPQIKAVEAQVAGLKPNQRLKEVVIEVRLDYQFLAKTHHPGTLLRHFELPMRGTSTWGQVADSSPSIRAAKRKPNRAIVESRSLFLSATENQLAALRGILEAGSKVEQLKMDFIKIQEVRLPEAKDRLRIHTDNLDSIPLEIVLFGWDRRNRDEAIGKILALQKPDSSNLEPLVRSYLDGPTFIAMQVPKANVEDLGSMNFLRVARDLPRVRTEKSSSSAVSIAPPPPEGDFRPKHQIAVFDGGVRLPHPYLDNYVTHTDLTSRPPWDFAVEHGTAVCSAALYGPIAPDAPLSQPTCGILSFRVLPDRRHEFYELYGVIDAIEEQVPKLPPEVRVINLSVGPDGTIDPAPSRFTYAIDRLSYEQDKLFFIAAGNTGDKQGCEGIQAPADSVNNLSIGAYTHAPLCESPEPAPYSSKGPGRSGARVKPDFLAFGGCAQVPFKVLSPEGIHLDDTWGTSFAAPLAASRAGELFARAPRTLSTQAVRALLIQSASENKHNWKNHGWGLLTESVDEIMACSKQKVSILYQDTVSPKNSWKLPYLLPPGFSPEGKVRFNWTIVLTPEVSPDAVDEYTLAGLVAQFRPNCFRFTFSPPRPKSKNMVQKMESPVVLDIRNDIDQIDEYLAKGWSQSRQPAPDKRKGKRHESVLRADEAKWDTVVRGGKEMDGSDIADPCLTISVYGRGEWDEPSELISARFAALLSIESPAYGGDLYNEVVTKYKLLSPLQLRAKTEVQIPIQTKVNPPE